MRNILMAALAVCLASSSWAGETKRLKFGLETSRSDSQFHGATVMADYVKEKTGGSVEIRIYPDSAFGSTVSVIGQTRSGTVDIYLTGSGNLGGMVEALNAFDVPFLFKNHAHVDRVMDGPIGRAIMDDCDAFDIKGLALWENGFRCLTNSRNAARVPDDVKGLKIRVPGMPMHVKAWELLGANPVPMNYSEVFTALETKTIDAQDHPIAITYSSRFYEMQKYLSMSNHAYTPLLLFMNLKSYDSLTPEERKIIMEGAHLGAVAQRKFVRDNEAKFVDEMEKYGIEVARDIDQGPWKDKIFGAMVEHVKTTFPKAAAYLEPIEAEGGK